MARSARFLSINMLKEDEKYYSSKIRYIAGTDEAGRGPLCGPLVVASCILPVDFNDDLINDSKKLTAKKREMAFKIILKKAVDYSIEIIDVDTIDRINIYEASKLGMILACRSLKVHPDLVLSDAMPINGEKFKVINIVHGDALSKNIAAASILAKVTRDHILQYYDSIYPMYDLKHNKGYGTKKHMEAIEKNGIIKGFHRLSYAPCSFSKINLFEKE